MRKIMIPGGVSTAAITYAVSFPDQALTVATLVVAGLVTAVAIDLLKTNKD